MIRRPGHLRWTCPSDRRCAWTIIKRRKLSRPHWQNAEGESRVRLARRPSWAFRGKLLNRKLPILGLTNIVSSLLSPIVAMPTRIAKKFENTIATTLLLVLLLFVAIH